MAQATNRQNRLKIIIQPMTLFRCFLATLLVSLASCASTPSNDDHPSAGRRAAEVNTQLGQAYMERGQYEIALDKLKKAVREDSGYAPAHTVLAVLYERIGEIDLAARHYAAAAKADPEDGDVNNNYGAFLCRNGEPGEADALFRKALEDPFYATPEVALSNAGSCALSQGNDRQAEDYLRQALSRNAAFPDALINMAGLKYDAGDYFSARGFLQRYEGVGPMTAQSLMTGFQIESNLNNQQRAREYADRLLDRFPQSVEAEEIRRNRNP